MNLLYFYYTFVYLFRNLNNNLITNLSANCLDTLTNLVEFKISHNKLNNLPVGLFKKLKNLETL